MAIPPPPTTYVCPITKKLMKEPVRSRHGRQHYERYAIMEWMDGGNHFCPVTGTPLMRSHLVPNKTLQWKIDSWASDNGGGQPSVDDDESPNCVDASTSTPGNHRARHHEPPQRFHCPLSRTLMMDPVVTAEGINFERTVILEWLEVNESCPVTGKPLLPSEVFTNETLRREIELWCAIHMDSTSGGTITLIDGHQRPMCDSTTKRRQSSMSSTSSLSISLSSSSSSSSSSISSMLSSSSMGLLLAAATTGMVPPVSTVNKTVAPSSSSLTTMLRALPPITGDCYKGTRTGRSSSSSTSSSAFEAIGKTSLIAAINDALEFSAIQIHD